MSTLSKTQLHEYQKHCVKFSLDPNKKGVGLFLDMGLGKTITSLTIISDLLNELAVSKTLIVGPKRVVESVWEQEAVKWTHTHGLTFSRVMGSSLQRKRALEVKADVYLISRDNIAWLCGLFGGSSVPFDMLIIDELSSFKNSKSVRFKALRQVLGSFSKVIGLTGTPAPNGLIDLWSQIYLLDEGERFGKRITKYREEYFKPDKRNGAIIYSYKPQENSNSKIYDKISDICVSMKAEDYLKMPDKILIDYNTNLSEATIKKYSEFEKSMVLSLFSDSVTGEPLEISTANAAALSNKLLQFCNGAVYDEDKNVHNIHDEKLDSLEDIVEAANGKPVIVATAFKHDSWRIQERFKKMSPRVLSGQEDIDDWNAGKINMLLLHPASGGHGLNLQKGGNTIIWFGLTWSLELYQQLVARLYRQGQDSAKVFIYHLYSPDTVERNVMLAIDKKDGTQKSLMLAVKAIVDKYV